MSLNALRAPADWKDDMTETSGEWLSLLKTLKQTGRVALADWPSDAITPDQLGLLTQGAFIATPDSVRLYDESYLAAQLRQINPAATLRLFDAVDSTNTSMARDAQTLSREGYIYLAEFQTAGRGRRGRAWVGDFGRNVAMTMGYLPQRELAELGGLSCVVGLAMVQMLEDLGVRAALKWPNDVWVQDRKLAGILVELVQTPRGAFAVIGIGLNVDLSPERMEVIDQEVTSLRSLDVVISREDLVVAIYKNVLANVDLFVQEGFDRFIPAFNAVHRLQDSPAVLLAGRLTREGVVRGVDQDGALLFEENGEICRVTGGEVSLRPSKFGKT